MELQRSWMFVPGHRQRMIDKALGLNADAVMLDLEDGVAPDEKATARKLIGESLTRERQSSSPKRYVRINAIGHQRMEDDLDAVLQPGLDGLVLPKVENSDEVRTVESVVAEREADFGKEPGTVHFLVAIESPKGLLKAAEIAACSQRITGLMFGAEDFGRELGLPTSREGEAQELLYARSALVISAAAAHVQAVDGVWVDLQDPEGLKRFALQSRRLGFSGMSAIHPSQIDPINAMFSPTAEEIEYAEKVTQAYADALARGDGSIAFGGQLIDRPIIERARRTLELAESLGLRA
jgi:citrate lyase subunit beta/citryl-CoA lyase